MSPTPSAREVAATIAARRPARLSPTPTSVSVSARAPIDRVRESLPGPLQAIPLRALLAGVGLALITVVVFTSAMLRSESAIAALEDDGSPTAAPSAMAVAGASAAAPAAAHGPTTTELDAARIGGIDALKALALRFPEDASVLQALGVVEARDRKTTAAALEALRRLLEIAPDRATDKEVQQVLLDLASGPPEVAADAFAVLETKMGSTGPDLIYELSQRANLGKYTKDRAATALNAPEVIKAESSALRIAEELRRRTGCGRKELIARVTTDGDGRSLPYLRPLVAAKNCSGFALFRSAECYACFTPQNRTAITAAIEAIEKRDPGR
jgi:hypothetical protein